MFHARRRRQGRPGRGAQRRTPDGGGGAWYAGKAVVATDQAIQQHMSEMVPGGVKSVAAGVGAVASKVGNLGKIAEDVPVAVKATEEVPAIAKNAEETGKTVTKTAQAAEEASQAVRVTRNGYGYLLDKLGRTIRAAGKLKLNKAARDVDARRAAGGADRLATDQGGHLIGSRFDGTSDALNTVAQNQNLNQGAWKAMENSWDRALQAGQEVLVDVRPQYIGDSLRPSSFDVNYCLTEKNSRSSLVMSPDSHLGDKNERMER